MLDGEEEEEEKKKEDEQNQNFIPDFPDFAQG